MSEIASWFTEDPTYIVITCGVVAAIFALVVFLSGRVVFAWGIGIPVAIALLALMSDFLVVTDRERVGDVIAEGAAALTANDMKRVLALISPSAVDLRATAAMTMKAITFKDVRVTTTPKIVINKSKSPWGALAVFSAVAELKGTTGELGEFKVPKRVEVHFERLDDHWVITEAKWRSIVGEDDTANDRP